MGCFKNSQNVQNNHNVARERDRNVGGGGGATTKNKGSNGRVFHASWTPRVSSAHSGLWLATLSAARKAVVITLVIVGGLGWVVSFGFKSGLQ